MCGFGSSMRIADILFCFRNNFFAGLVVGLAAVWPGLPVQGLQDWSGLRGDDGLGSVSTDWSSWQNRLVEVVEVLTGEN